MSDVALRFGARDDGLNAQFNKTGKDLDALQNKVSKAGTVISASFSKIAVAAAAIGFGKLIGDAVEFADQLEAATIRTGISIAGLQKLQFVASQTSGNLDTLTAAVGKMQLNLSKAGEGADEAEKALARLHIPIGEFIGLKPDEQFEKVAIAIAKVEDPTARAAAAQGLFGKSYQENLPVLVSTGTELEKLSVQFDAIGGAVSKENIDRVDDLGDSFATLKIATKSLATELLALGSPEISAIFGALSRFAAGLRIAAGGGDNQIINLDTQIRDLELRRDRILQTPNLTQEFLQKQVVGLNAQIEALKKSQERLLGVGLEGAAAEKARIAAIDAQLTPVTITQKRITRFEDTPEGKRQAALNKDNPLFVQAQTEADFLVDITRARADEQLRIETDLSRARLNLQDDTGASLLDKIDAFTGQVINFAQFRADFEQNAQLATLGLVGQALSATFQKNKGLQIAMATISTISGVARALADYPYPYSLIIGGAVALAGAGQIAKIKSTNYNASGTVSGGSVGGVSGGAVGSASSASSPVSAPPAPQERKVAQIIINGPITGEQSMRWLVENLRQYVGDFDLVLQPAGR